jgi:hypothetical protein
LNGVGATASLEGVLPILAADLSGNAEIAFGRSGVDRGCIGRSA